jgi:hypothetical protein
LPFHARPLRKGEKARLQTKGWKVGTVQVFLGLSGEEAAYIEVRLCLAGNLSPSPC